jgi:hypothetical protein
VSEWRHTKLDEKLGSVDIASLGLRVETGGVKEGVANLDWLAAAGDKAVAAEKKLADQSTAASVAICNVGAAAKGAAEGTSALSTAMQTLNQQEELAHRALNKWSLLHWRSRRRISLKPRRRVMPRKHRLNRREAAAARASMLKPRRSRPFKTISMRSMMRSPHTSENLGQVADKRQFVAALERSGALSTKEAADAYGVLEKQEQSLKKSIDSHAASVQALLRAYDRERGA